MSAPDARAAVISDAWSELEALAVKARQDWRPEDVAEAVIAAKAAMPFDRGAREMWRAIWDAESTPAELRNTARSIRPQPVTGPEVGARGRQLAQELYDNRPAARQEAGTVTTHPGNTNHPERTA